MSKGQTASSPIFNVNMIEVKNMAKLWGGRFQKSAEAWVDEFGASIGFDQQLVMEDIEGSVAHVTMLGAQGILPAEDVAKILEGLAELKIKAEAGELRIFCSE